MLPAFLFSVLQVPVQHVFLRSDGSCPSPLQLVSGPDIAAFPHLEPAARRAGSADLGDDRQLGRRPAAGGGPGSLAGTQTSPQD